ncbi:toll/interleukin-1 receptor domain-containing protein [Okeania sp. SIO1I7]|uniref:toll/interleukin-1 receptor domain-containing protein n=1 Tax=Okeania sp. SIO1I7 TaxID=2607772 RepID=UPI0013FCCBEC|nr:toll/interleukin-1 receptor domain-containing protein [Okeania sp. SIO1I7]NET26083.1 toll/interleukin-1 receptor domain-containing protein [Okeania sp. SIO1I7]
MVEEKEFDVFLCYDDKDKGKVENIAKQLKKRGIKCWDKSKLPPGSSWQRKLEQQIKNIKAAAVFIGNNRSELWENNEIRPYLQKFQNRGCSVIPVFLVNAPKKTPQLPTFFTDKISVDFRDSQSSPIDRLFLGITGKVNEQEVQVQKFLKILNKHLQTIQEGGLYFPYIQKSLEESKLLETLIKENSARQEKERQKKPIFLGLIFLLLLVGGIGGFGGFKLHEKIAQEQINQDSQTEITLKEKDEKIKEKDERKKNPIVKEPEDTRKSNNAKENSNQSPSTRPTANLKTDKTTYSRLEPITVNFSFEGIPHSEKYRIELALSSNRAFYGNDYSNVGENGMTTFEPQRPGDYEIRAYVYPGKEWVPVDKLSIKVTSEF